MCWSIATTKLPTKITFKPQFAVSTFSFLAEFSAKIWFRMMKPSSGFVHNTIYMLVLKHCKDHWIPFSIYKTYTSCMQRAKMYSMGKKASNKQIELKQKLSINDWMERCRFFRVFLFHSFTAYCALRSTHFKCAIQINGYELWGTRQRVASRKSNEQRAKSSA